MTHWPSARRRLRDQAVLGSEGEDEDAVESKGGEETKRRRTGDAMKLDAEDTKEDWGRTLQKAEDDPDPECSEDVLRRLRDKLRLAGAVQREAEAYENFSARVINAALQRERAAAEREGTATHRALLLQQDVERLRASLCAAQAAEREARRAQQEAERQLAAAEADRAQVERKLRLQLEEAERNLHVLLESRHKPRAATAVPHGAWKYEAKCGWEAFTADASAELVRAYLRFLGCTGPSSVDVTSGGRLRRVDFRTMQQQNVATGVCRKVRLDLGVPSTWTRPPCLLLSQEDSYVYVWEDNWETWDAIAQLMSRTAHVDACKEHPDSSCQAMRWVRVSKVWRIENFALWNRYTNKTRELDEVLARESRTPEPVSPRTGLLDPGERDTLRALGGGCSMNCALNECWLFHGTTYESANRIALNGFDNRIAEGGMYGSGTYFASQACKSHQYTCQWHPRKRCRCPERRTMLLARVLVGHPHYAREVCRKLRRPPEKAPGGELYDSIVANPGKMAGHHRQWQDHQEFVIFDSSQAYPSYWVEYAVE